MLQFTERTVTVAGESITLLEAGEGAPLLVLHEEMGFPGACEWHAEIARSRKLVVPIHPGFAGPRITWIRGVRDLSVLYGFLVRQEGLTGCDVIGFSFGGWVAAEMAVNNPDQFASMTLVAPFGVKPLEGYIKDMFPISSFDYMQCTVADPAGTPEFATIYGEDRPEKIEGWEDARTEMARIGWQPYMHDLSLPDLLKGLDLPTLVIHGEKDAIVPSDGPRRYVEAIPGARLITIPDVGHRPEIENRASFLEALDTIIKAAALAA